MLRSTRAHRRADKISALSRSRVVGVVTAFVAAVAIAAGGAAGARADAPDTVTLSDPALASCTATALQAPPDTDTFAAADVAALTSLTCQHVAGLSDIGDFTGLTALDLDNGTISDVSPLAALTGLTTLTLDVNHVLDLRPLVGLTATITARDETYSGPAQTVGVPFPLPTFYEADGSALPEYDSQNLTTNSAATIGTTTATQASISWDDSHGFSVGWDVTSAVGALSPTPPATFGSTVGVGQTLTATPGDWNPDVVLHYQWRLDGSPIAGATAQQFVVPDAAYRHAISVDTIGTEDGYTTATVPSTAVIVGAGALTHSLSSPVILGTPTVFQKLTLRKGDWGPDDVTFTYQWLRDGSPIARATASSYTLTTGDAKHAISVRLTGQRAEYDPTTVTSDPVTIAGAALTRVITPVISGKAATGNTLSALHGPWAPSGLTFAYRWNRNGSPISGAIHSTYKLGASDVHQSITVTVSGWKTGYASATRSSKAVTPSLGTITGAPTPTITGTVATAHIVTANVGTCPGGVTVKTQWRRNGVNVSGATAKTYAIHSGDAGATISVVATGSKPGYKSLARVSAGHTVPTPAPAAPSCTNGTYVNSAGHTVCRPETASSPPAGATAQCKDGTYSFSESRSGTCSHHGGVAVWY